MEVTIEEITVDVEIVGRADGLDSEIVQTYADRMEAGDVFPPIELVGDGDVFWLVDGQHRLEAAKKVNLEKIEANVTHGDRRGALWMSLASNETHGLRQTNEDKRKKVTAALEDEELKKKSDREIARQCNVSDWLVSKIRDLTSSTCSEKTERTYTTKHGTQAVMNTTNIGGNNKEKEIQQIKEEFSKPPLKYLLAEYASLLTKANIASKTMVANHDEYDIRAAFQNDAFLRSGVSKAIAVNNDFIEGVKNGFQSKSN